MFKEEDDGVDMDREEVGRSRAAPALTLRPHCPPTPGWCATASCVLPEHNYPEWASRPREQLFLHPEQRESVSHLIACWLARERARNLENHKIFSLSWRPPILGRRAIMQLDVSSRFGGEFDHILVNMLYTVFTEVVLSEK